jgi:hypothetical protein
VRENYFAARAAREKRFCRCQPHVWDMSRKKINGFLSPLRFYASGNSNGNPYGASFPNFFLSRVESVENTAFVLFFRPWPGQGRE